MADTVIAALATLAQGKAARTAWAHKEAGRWQETTFARYYALVRRAARGLMALGIGPGRNVAILSANRPEWFLSSLGATAAGAIPAGIYTTSSPEQCAYIAHHCDAAVAVVGNEAHLRTLLALRDQLPLLRHLVLAEGESKEPGVLGWEEMLRRGEAVEEGELDARIASLDPEGCTGLIYTSGTTGPPKAVMISHRNILWTARSVCTLFDVDERDRGLCYLPLSHVAEQCLSLYAPLVSGLSTWFAESLEKVPENLREVRPSFFLAVPRVWEKMQAAIENGLQTAGPLRRRLVAWAQQQGLHAGYAEQRGEARPPGFAPARALVFSKLRRRLGLDRARICAVSTAPVTRETLEFFLGFGIPILEIYGMSECSGPATVSTPKAHRTGRAGRALPGTDVRIAEDGEILIRGPHVFPGYFKDEEATRAILDSDGFLHSGDVGELDADGYLKVTDRKKELLVTSGGKKTGPTFLESRLKQLPAVAHAVVVGDGRHYLAALFTLDPLRLAAAATTAGSPARDIASAASCPLFRAHLERELEGVNAQFARFETIKRFALLDAEWSVAGGELTPTLKLRRKAIAEKYRAEIDRLYA